MTEEAAKELNKIMLNWRITANKLIEIMEPKEFYMIYVEGQDSPTRKHLTYQDAEKEAERLARMMHKKTYILGTIEYFEVNDIIRTKCNVGELPF